MGVSTALAIGSTVAGLAGARSQSRAANRASQQQAAAQAEQMALAREGLDWNRQRYSEWQGLFMPILDDLREEAYADRGPDYSAIAADVGTAFDTSQDINRRQQMRYGLNPGDGAMQAGEISYGLGRARATVDARNKARIANRDSRFNRLSNLWGMGGAMMTSALGGVNAGYGAAGNAAGNAAAMYGNNAAIHGQGAAAGMQMAFNGLGQAANYYQQNNPPPGG